MAAVRKCVTCGEWFAVDTAHECDPTGTSPDQEPKRPYALTANDKRFLKAIRVTPEE